MRANTIFLSATFIVASVSFASAQGQGPTSNYGDTVSGAVASSGGRDYGGAVSSTAAGQFGITKSLDPIGPLSDSAYLPTPPGLDEEDNPATGDSTPLPEGFF